MPPKHTKEEVPSSSLGKRSTRAKRPIIDESSSDEYEEKNILPKRAKKDNFKEPKRVEQQAIVIKNEGKVVLPKKEYGQRTLVEIIEDANSGLPAKSEVDRGQKRAFLKKNKGTGSKSVTQSEIASQISSSKRSQISESRSKLQPLQSVPSLPQMGPRYVQIDGKLVLQEAPAFNYI